MKQTITAMTSLVVVGCGLLAAPGVVLAGEEGDRTVTDRGITNALEHAVLLDRAVSSNRIDVSTINGIVTLTGTVENLLAQERTVRLAEAIRGVRAVVNRLEVRPPLGSNDEDVRLRVERALAADPATDSYEVDTTVTDGWVTLEGTVQSWSEKELSATVAKGVRGVIGLTNDIEIEYEPDRPDFEIQQEIERALDTNVLIDAGLVTVEVDDGTVTLSGVLGSAAEKRLAYSEAWTAGVHAVDVDNVRVERWARDPDLRRGEYVPQSAEELRTAIDAALTRDPRVTAFEVETSVQGCGLVLPNPSPQCVTLRGTVDNLKAKRAAEQDARNTAGVLTVVNLLKVRPSMDRSDGAIEADVEGALVRDPYVSRADVTVSVYDGVAYLSGTVDSYYEKAQADDATARVNGVVAVVNNLLVEDRPFAANPRIDPWNIYAYDWYSLAPTYSSLSDREIRLRIEYQLWWSPFVDADEVTVHVEDGVATLSGTVDSWTERGAARDNAYDGGATHVRNQLDVSS